jgi:hypothetical protein
MDPPVPAPRRRSPLRHPSPGHPSPRHPSPPRRWSPPGCRKPPCRGDPPHRRNHRHRDGNRPHRSRNRPCRRRTRPCRLPTRRHRRTPRNTTPRRPECHRCGRAAHCHGNPRRSRPTRLGDTCGRPGILRGHRIGRGIPPRRCEARLRSPLGTTPRNTRARRSRRMVHATMPASRPSSRSQPGPPSRSHSRPGSRTRLGPPSRSRSGQSSRIQPGPPSRSRSRPGSRTRLGMHCPSGRSSPSGTHSQSCSSSQLGTPH